MEDLFTEAAIARVARIQTVAEESGEEPEKALIADENAQKPVENDSSGVKDKDNRTVEENELEKTTVTAKAAPKAHKFKRKHQEDDSNQTIFVGNVPATIKKKKLKQFFKYTYFLATRLISTCIPDVLCCAHIQGVWENPVRSPSLHAGCRSKNWNKEQRKNCSQGWRLDESIPRSMMIHFMTRTTFHSDSLE